MRDAEGVRTTLDLDDDVLTAAKELAAMRQKTAGQIVSELLRKALEPAPELQGPERRADSAAPAGARLITTADVRRWADEDD